MILTQKPKDPKLRKVVCNFLKNGREYPPGSPLREWWIAYARGMAMGLWLFERMHRNGAIQV